MKLLFSSVHSGRSAGTWYAMTLARKLQERGHEVVYLPRPLPAEIDPIVAAGLPVIRDCDLEEKSPNGAYRNLRRLGTLIAELGPDAVVAFGGEDHTFWGLAKSIYARRMALIRARVLDPKPPRRHPLSLWLHRRATDFIVTANTRHYRSYRTRLKVIPDRLQIIPAGIDPEDFAALDDAAMAANAQSLPDDGPIVVMVARFAPIKGHRTLLGAAAKVRRRRPDARFLFVGYPVDYTAADFDRRIVEYNMSGAISIIDRPLPALPALLARCQVGVIASLGSETVSRSLLEYLGAGLPVVATDVGGIPDLLDKGRFGILIPPDDAGRLSEAILTLLEDPARARSMGQAGRDYVLAECRWSQRTDDWEKLLYRVVARVRGESIPVMADAPEGERV